VKQCLDFHPGQVPPLRGQGNERLHWRASELLAEFLIRQETAYDSFDYSPRHGGVV